MKKNIIQESVLDPIRKYRCDALFNQNDKSEQPVILQTTKQFIFSILNQFKDTVGKKNFDYTEAFIIGSSLGYQYRDDSDIDIDVRITLPRSDMHGFYHCIPKNIILPNTAHPVNIFVLTADDPPYNFENAENAYDLLTDTWIKQGRLSNADAIPYEYVTGVSEFIMDGMSLELNRTERDLYDLRKYVEMDPNKVAISESERKEAISNKIAQLIIDKDALELAHTLIFRLESDGFEDKPICVSIKYTYQDKHFTMNNLIYKYIDRYGYYEKINAKVDEIDKAIADAQEALKQVAEDSPETANAIATQEEIMEKAKETEVPESTQPETAIEPTNNVPEEQPQAPQEDELQEEPTAETVAVAEAYNDTELKSILIENGYNGTDLNIYKLKTQPYIIYEDLTSRTEKDISRKIYKASGNMHQLVADGLGFLFAGLFGTLIADSLWNSSKDERDDRTVELREFVDSDPECQNILSEIREELKQENPDKRKLRDLKRKFGKALSGYKKMKNDDEKEYYVRAQTASKISLREE